MIKRILKMIRKSGRNILRYNLYNKLKRLLDSESEIERLFPKEALLSHYVFIPMRNTREHPDLFINQVRYYRIYEFFRKNYPELFSEKTKVFDIGDTSGILFKAMKRKGLSVNINPDTVNFIRNNGIEAEVGDIENLPFQDKSCEYAFCFECIEHVSNPIRALKEISRITQKKIFLSIPYVKKTAIYELGYWKKLLSQDISKGGWAVSDTQDADCHKFEFSTQDFKKIISYANLRYCDSFPINYFKVLGSICKNEGSYFNFFILEPLNG